MLRADIGTLLAVDTGVVVIVVAVAVVLVVLIVALSLRGRQVRAAERRLDSNETHERAGRAERDPEVIGRQIDSPTDDVS